MKSSQETSDRKRNPGNPRMMGILALKRNSLSDLFTPTLEETAFSWLGKNVVYHQLVDL